MGVALLFATFGFGADRFYVGQVGVGMGLLIAYLSVFGVAVAGPVQLLSSISLVMSILFNHRTAFMYGSETFFEESSVFDKVIAAVWIFTVLASIALFITLFVVLYERERSLAVHP